MDTFQANMYSQASNFNKQAYDYFLVLDFEATCDDTQKSQKFGLFLQSRRHVIKAKKSKPAIGMKEKIKERENLFF